MHNKIYPSSSLLHLPNQIHINFQVANIGSPSQNKGADKVKQFVGKLDRLVHSEQTDIHNKEVSR